MLWLLLFITQNNIGFEKTEKNVGKKKKKLTFALFASVLAQRGEKSRKKERKELPHQISQKVCEGKMEKDPNSFGDTMANEGGDFVFFL